MADKNTLENRMLELAQETARLQLLSFRDEQLIQNVLAAFPTMTRDEAIRHLKLAGV
jgi:hypothetical protein